MIKEPDFVYINTKNSVHGEFLDNIDFKLFAIWASCLYYDKEIKQGVFLSNKRNIEKIADSLNIKESMVRKHINKLVRNGLMCKTKYKGLFVVNPNIIVLKNHKKDVEEMSKSFVCLDGIWYYKD